MKIIRITTIYEAINYGAVLQAFALQNAVARIRANDDVKIVRYRPQFIKNDLEKIRFHIGRGLKKWGHAVFDIAFLNKRIKKLNEFSSFCNHFLALSEEIHCGDTLDSDVLISGSDQIWNPYLTDNSVDAVYFGTCVSDTCKKISYASSFGDYQFDDAYTQTIVDSLSSYCSISVRERTAAEKLSGLLGKPVDTVIDPTFLLTQGQWSDLLKLRTKKNANSYIFMFSVQGYKVSKELVHLGKLMAKTRNLQLVMLGSEVPIPGVKVLRNASPAEFVELIHNAAIVLTNSFHGTAFSMILEKPFLVTSNHAGPGRILSLLDEVGLVNHYCTQFKEKVDYGMCEVDYDVVRPRIEALRTNGLTFLQTALQKSLENECK